MPTDEISIDEIRAELRQLCTELERVRAVTEETSSKNTANKQELECTADKTGNAAKPVRHERNDQGNRT